MRNKILHALSNRPGPFPNRLLGHQPEFQPARFSGAMNQLRDKLLLNAATDYYLMRYLCLLEAFPEIKQELADTVVTYRVWDFLPRGVEMDGAELLSASNVSGRYVEPEANPLPINLNYIIDYASDVYARITALESGLVRIAGVIVSGFSPQQWMRVEWPAEIPFTGPLLLQQPWVTGAQIRISVEPHRFPYDQMVERIKSDDQLNNLLVQHNLAGVFHAGVDPLEQLAIALLVVAQGNPSVYG